ncbi:hypothetical protein DYB32_004090 [Aphanomyces invadans]|uniref:Bromodomain associated domain-containing protein n=1 Tax=Aphanomyces invadans TaxID=157072 RepID=A0A418AYN3_9STRA|nr:hypothetical protein DYB32_004090 [Aphanomyces invadans]
MAVTNILAKGAGFEYVQPSATTALVDIMAAYIQKIGKAAQELAEVAGRAKPRGTDVSLALKDMVPYPVGLDDMIKAFQESQHRYEGKLAFPREVPKFPAPSKKRKSDDSFEEDPLYVAPTPSYRPVVAKPTKRTIEVMSANDNLSNDNSSANNQKYDDVVIEPSHLGLSRVKEDKILAGTYHEGDSD